VDQRLASGQRLWRTVRVAGVVSPVAVVSAVGHRHHGVGCDGVGADPASVHRPADGTNEAILCHNPTMSRSESGTSTRYAAISRGRGTGAEGRSVAGVTDLVDVPRLETWLAARDLLVGDGDLTVAPLGQGHSNLTYLVRRGDEQLVLRRPPRGPRLPTAHDVVREARVLELLEGSGSDVRVPRVRAVCDDDSVMGAPFFLMDRSPGVVVRDSLPDFMSGPRGLGARRAVGVELPRVLGGIHTVDWRPFVDAGIGRPEGYLGRQLRRWVGQREGIQAAVAAAGGRARDLPDYDAVRDWLREHLPEESEPAVVHGDFKLDNVIVEPTAYVDATGEPMPSARIAAVVDWEMATVGDPRADLGYLLSFWPEPGETVPLAELVSVAPGFPLRDEVVGVWEQTTGRHAGDMRWFVALAGWKLAILLEASYHRWLAGRADDPFFARLDDGVPALLARARDVCGA
jgi:aminoglycoside phosphotransferase (APT) family kinase protein